MQTHDENSWESDEQNNRNDEAEKPTSLHLAAGRKMKILPKDAQRLHITGFDLDIISF